MHDAESADVRRWEQVFLQAVSESGQELLDLAGALIKAPSENPPGDCSQVATVIADHLQRNGVDVHIENAGDGRLTVFAQRDHGEGKRLVFSGHHDVVPVGDRARWSFDPFAGDVVNGELRGRGASDMKGGLAGLIHAFVLLERLGLPHRGALALMAVPDEETGGARGTDYVLDQLLPCGADGAIIGEPAERTSPTIGQKGSNWFRLRFKGRPGHGSLQPVHGTNANLLAARAAIALQRLWEMEAHPDPAAIDLIDLSAKRVEMREGYQEGVGEVFRRVTVNIGTLRGGSAANVVSDTCVMEVDTRVPIGLARAEVLDRVLELLADEGIEAQLEPIGFCSEPNWTHPQDDVVVATMSALQELVDPGAEAVLQWASSDARCFRQRNIPVLQYGPATLHTIHGFDERCPADDVILAAKVYGLAAIRFLGIKKGNQS